MSLHSLLLISAIVAAASPSPNTASDPDVTIEDRRLARGIELSLRNRKPYEVTATTTLTLENLRADVASPVTATYPPQSTTVIGTLTVVENGRPFRWKHHYDWVSGTLAPAHDDAVYLLPYERGRSFRVLQGENSTFSHHGKSQYAIDWAMSVGSRVCAARGGLVVKVGVAFTEGGTDEALKNRGNAITIRQDDGTIAEYVHLRQGGASVEVGDRVAAGDPIGFSGNVGYSTEPHLHFVVYKAVDGKTRASLPLSFRTKRGVERLREGRRYEAVR